MAINKRKGIIGFLILAICLIFIPTFCQNRNYSWRKKLSELHPVIQSDNIISGDFIVTFMDGSIFDHYVIRLESSDGQKFILLSLKKISPDFQMPFERYKEIELGGVYDIKLNKYDSLPKLEIELRAIQMRQDNFEYDIYDKRFDRERNKDSIPFWRKDSILTEVYYSNQIYDRYIELSDTKPR